MDFDFGVGRLNFDSDVVEMEIRGPDSLANQQCHTLGLSFDSKPVGTFSSFQTYLILQRCMAEA